jgi:hypothetical protein
MEEVTGGQVNCLLDVHQVWKESGRNKSTSPFPELTLEELILLYLSAATGS